MQSVGGGELAREDRRGPGEKHLEEIRDLRRRRIADLFFYVTAGGGVAWSR